jgi:transcriptional regulator with XRE-family HTH domain
MTELRTNEEIGQLIRKLREERGLTQAEVGEPVNLDKTAMSKVEAGARAVTAKEVVGLADFFLIPTDAILRHEDEAVLLRAGEAEPDGVKRSLDLFAECIEDYLGLEALLT